MKELTNENKDYTISSSLQKKYPAYKTLIICLLIFIPFFIYIIGKSLVTTSIQNVSSISTTSDTVPVEYIAGNFPSTIKNNVTNCPDNQVFTTLVQAMKNGQPCEIVADTTNSYKVLSSDIGKLTSLTELDFNGSDLTVIPSEIGLLKNLQLLDISATNVVQLPDTLNMLAQLRLLDLDNTQLQYLPTSLNGLINLQIIFLMNSTLVSKYPQELVKLVNIPHSLWIDMTRENISHLPRQIGSITNLQKLDLSENNLTTLPEQIGNLSNLEELTITENNLSTLPSQFSKLKKLKVINITVATDTSLKEIFSILATLPKLQVINLNGYLTTNGGIHVLPPEIGKLTNITELDLSYNHLRSLPGAIANLTHLKKLNLFHNDITTLPPEIGNMTHLQELILSDNLLTTIPTTIAQLHYLTLLDIKNYHTSCGVSSGPEGAHRFCDQINENHFSQQEITHIQQLLPRTTVFY